MKKFFCSLIFFFILFNGFSFSVNPFDFSEKTPVLYFEPLAGYSYGTIFEYVYATDKNTGSVEKLSELDWDLTNAYFFGGKLGVSYSFFDFSLYAKGYIPVPSGIMQDSDWQNKEDWSMKTNYSISENYLNDAFSLETDFFVSALKNSWFNLRGSLSLEYQYYSFSAVNAYGWYGDSDSSSDHQSHYWYDTEAKEYKKGDLCGIDYQFSRSLIWLGLDFTFTPFWLNLNAGVKVPVLSYFTDIDFHASPGGGTYYYDQTISSFSAVFQYYNIIFDINENFSLRMGYEYMYSLFCIGLDSVKHTDSYEEYSDSFGGNAASVMNWTLSAIFKLK